MPVMICAKCGAVTNSAVAEWLSPIRKDGKANECYARRNKENTKWEKGCSEPECDAVKKVVANILIEESKGEKK